MVQHRKSKLMIRVGKSSKLLFCGYLLAKFKPSATTIPVEPIKKTRGLPDYDRVVVHFHPKKTYRPKKLLTETSRTCLVATPSLTSVSDRYVAEQVFDRVNCQTNNLS